MKNKQKRIMHIEIEYISQFEQRRLVQNKHRGRCLKL